jgi:hypothetical protein
MNWIQTLIQLDRKTINSKLIIGLNMHLLDKCKEARNGMSKVNNTLPMISEEMLRPPRRLIVLVPNQSLDEPELIQLIAALALSHHLTVLFLDVIESTRQEPAAHLRLANLSALITAFSIENE